MNIDEYEDAERIVEVYKVCSGCNTVLRTEEMHRTIQYGATNYWCETCYESIKNDW
jgi:hypothetical protein